MRSVENFSDITDRNNWISSALGENGLEVTFEEGAGVLEVFFGVSFGGGDALKRFIEDADDPLLFEELGNWNRNFLELAAR